MQRGVAPDCEKSQHRWVITGCDRHGKLLLLAGYCYRCGCPGEGECWEQDPDFMLTPVSLAAFDRE